MHGNANKIYLLYLRVRLRYRLKSTDTAVYEQHAALMSLSTVATTVHLVGAKLTWRREGLKQTKFSARFQPSGAMRFRPSLSWDVTWHFGMSITITWQKREGLKAISLTYNRSVVKVMSFWTSTMMTQYNQRADCTNCNTLSATAVVKKRKLFVHATN
jgi:hypothetical protein